MTSPVQLMHSSKSFEWYTPAIYIKAVKAVMGRIDLDPASSEEANQTVGATKFLSLADNGLSTHWYGKVFLNPPYGTVSGRSRVAFWVAKLTDEYRLGFTEEAILLVNAVTEAEWFRDLWAHPICFTDHRIRFEGPGNKSQPTKGNAFVYFGFRTSVFIEHFSVFGHIVTPNGGPR